VGLSNIVVIILPMRTIASSYTVGGAIVVIDAVVEVTMAVTGRLAEGGGSDRLESGKAMN